MRYTGKLRDGSVFDRSTRFVFQLGIGEVIKGWDLGVAGMRVGERARLTIPPELGYGNRGSGNIPGEATLIFEVPLNAIR